MTWQDIETAPKDGTPFLAYCPGRGVCVVSYEKDRYSKSPRPYFKVAGFGVPRTLDDRADQPTHWQPFPAPPESSNG